MRRIPSEVVVHGAVAGLVAGVVVALWFLVVDAIRASPFHTPLVLAEAVLGPEPRASAGQLVFAYTILHFGAFAAIGVGLASLLWLVGIAPRIIVGIATGVIVLEAVHYGALLLTGADVIAVLPPGHVLAANIAGGVAMMIYLHHALSPDAPFAWSVLREHEAIARGAATGVIGAAAVALWFLVIDTLMGVPFFTPAALGSAVFLGAASPEQVRFGAGMVAAYTVVHVAVFVAAGILLNALAGRLERAPGFWMVAVMALIIVGGAFMGMMTAFAGWIMGALGLWAVAGGSIVGVLTMAIHVWRTHPLLRRRLLDEPIQTRY